MQLLSLAAPNEIGAAKPTQSPTLSRSREDGSDGFSAILDEESGQSVTPIVDEKSADQVSQASPLPSGTVSRSYGDAPIIGAGRNNDPDGPSFSDESLQKAEVAPTLLADAENGLAPTTLTQGETQKGVEIRIKADPLLSQDGAKVPKAVADTLTFLKGQTPNTSEALTDEFSAKTVSAAQGERSADGWGPKPLGPIGKGDLATTIPGVDQTTVAKAFPKGQQEGDVTPRTTQTDVPAKISAGPESPKPPLPNQQVPAQFDLARDGGNPKPVAAGSIVLGAGPEPQGMDAARADAADPTKPQQIKPQMEPGTLPSATVKASAGENPGPPQTLLTGAGRDAKSEPERQVAGPVPPALGEKLSVEARPSETTASVVAGSRLVTPPVQANSATPQVPAALVSNSGAPLERAQISTDMRTEIANLPTQAQAAATQAMPTQSAASPVSTERPDPTPRNDVTLAATRDEAASDVTQVTVKDATQLLQTEQKPSAVHAAFLAAMTERMSFAEGKAKGVDGLTLDVSLTEGKLSEARVSADAFLNRAEQPRAPLTQILDAARRLPDGPIEISLSPEELGKVRMSLSGAEGAMSVQIMAERPETLELLRRHIDLLAAELGDQGYTSLSFSFGSGEDSPNTGSSAAFEDVVTADQSVGPEAPDLAETRLDSLKTGPSDRMDIRL